MTTTPHPATIVFSLALAAILTVPSTGAPNKMDLPDFTTGDPIPANASK